MKRFKNNIKLMLNIVVQKVSRSWIKILFPSYTLFMIQTDFIEKTILTIIYWMTVHSFIFVKL
jgi:hypothetical protein